MSRLVILGEGISGHTAALHLRRLLYFRSSCGGSP
jgi:glycine/D-amino acid oxidase-like deaminating enzyme